MAAATRPSTRDRMILSAALLIRERGARATSIDDVLAHSGAPRGSVYHHFPGGRDELVGEALSLAEHYVAGLVERHHGDPLAAYDEIVSTYRRDLERSDLRSGCPVAAVAIEHADNDTGSENASLQLRAGEVFGRWQEGLAATLVAGGVDGPEAASLAQTVIAALEGALMIARSRREIGCFDQVTQQTRGLVVAALEKASQR